MRLKRQYTAVIIIVMLIMTAIIASMVVSSVQGSRVAYVAVRADKASYELGENVTFKLTPLSPDVQYTTGDIGYSSVFYMIRLPDSVDPDTCLDDKEALQNLSTMLYGGSMEVRGRVPVPSFTTSGESIPLSWNGSLSAMDYDRNEVVWAQATAGYYIIYPMIQNYYSSTTKFMLDRSSIFYLGGLKVDFNITYADGNYKVGADLSLTEGVDDMEGMFSTAVPDYNFSEESSTTYHNETIHLTSGEVSQVTVQFPGYSSGYGASTTSLLCYFYYGEKAFLFGFYQYDSSEYQKDGSMRTEVRNVQF